MPTGGGRAFADLLEHWPVLVDQWLAELDRGGWRLPPDAVVELLGRWRNEPRAARRGPPPRRADRDLVGRAVPRRARPRTRAEGTSGVRRPSHVGERRLPPDIAPFVALDAGALAAALASGLDDGALGVRHRPALIDLLLQVPPERLATVADALERAGTNPTTMGLALSLADLARTRLAMLEELTP